MCLCVFVCVLPSSSHSCLYLSVMVVPCCLHMASLGSPMNCSVISISMRAPLESLIFSISLTCTAHRIMGEHVRATLRRTCMCVCWKQLCHLAEQQVELLPWAVVAALREEELDLLLNLLLVQMPAVLVVHAGACCRVRSSWSPYRKSVSNLITRASSN